MNIKRLIVIIVLIIVSIFVICVLKQKEKNERPEVRIPVILYHNFVETVPEKDADNFNYINTPQSFEENIKVLLENGYNIISMKELNDINNGKRNLPQKPILIHFDDGYYSNYEYIYPILKKYNVKVSIYIVTDKVGKDIDGIKYLSWADCLEMQNSGLVEIYSHSKRHVFYDKLPVRKLRDDVKESYTVIEKNLGKKNPKVFVYPYGASTKETVRTLKKNGIDMQVYDLGMNYFNTFDKNYIKRINIPCEMTGREIIEEIEKN